MPIISIQSFCVTSTTDQEICEKNDELKRLEKWRATILPLGLPAGMLLLLGLLLWTSLPPPVCELLSEAESEERVKAIFLFFLFLPLFFFFSVKAATFFLLLF